MSARFPYQLDTLEIRHDRSSAVAAGEIMAVALGLGFLAAVAVVALSPSSSSRQGSLSRLSLDAAVDQARGSWIDVPGIKRIDRGDGHVRIVVGRRLAGMAFPGEIEGWPVRLVIDA